MYEVTYTKKASKDLSKISKDKSLLETFNKIEKVLAENPYRPSLPPSRIPKNGVKLKNTNPPIYHVKLSISDRIFYRIDEYNKTIIVDTIEYTGNVVLLSLLGHDL